MGFFRSIRRAFKKAVKLANPITGVKETLRDPISVATVGTYEPIAKKKEAAKEKQRSAQEAAQKAQAESDKQQQEQQQRSRQNVAQEDSQQVGSTADATQILQQIQTMLNSNPTLLNAAEADDSEIRKKLGKGGRLSAGA